MRKKLKKNLKLLNIGTFTMSYKELVEKYDVDAKDIDNDPSIRMYYNPRAKMLYFQPEQIEQKFGDRKKIETESVDNINTEKGNSNEI